MPNKPRCSHTGTISGPILCACGEKMHEGPPGKYQCHLTKCKYHGKFYTAIAMRTVLFYKATDK